MNLLTIWLRRFQYRQVPAMLVMCFRLEQTRINLLKLILEAEVNQREQEREF